LNVPLHQHGLETQIEGVNLLWFKLCMTPRAIAASRRKNTTTDARRIAPCKSVVAAAVQDLFTTSASVIATCWSSNPSKAASYTAVTRAAAFCAFTAAVHLMCDDRIPIAATAELLDLFLVFADGPHGSGSLGPTEITSIISAYFKACSNRTKYSSSSLSGSLSGDP
jgi:hypothetical protein